LALFQSKKVAYNNRQAPLMPDLGTFTQEHTNWYRETLTALLESLAAGRINNGEIHFNSSNR